MSTLAGIGGEPGFKDGMRASFNSPHHVAVDERDGSVIVADSGNDSIRKISPTGQVTRVGGPIFGELKGICVDGGGTIIAADQGNNRIWLITTQGIAIPIAGDGCADWHDGIGTIAKFCSPFGVAVTRDGNVIVSDTRNNRIRKIETQLMPPARKGLPPVLPSTREIEMAALLEDDRFADVVFRVEQTEITAHKAVLASRSEYFSTMFSSAFREG